MKKAKNPPKKIINFLEKNKIEYDLLDHRIVFTAYDKANTLRLPEKTIAKVLLMSIDREKIFALLASNKRLCKVKFKEVINDRRKKKGLKVIKKIDFVKETWMKKNMLGIDLGALPPLGSLWKMETIADKSLMRQKEIVVSLGKYNFSVKVKTFDLKEKVPNLFIGDFSKVKK
ncbi:MAG: YbaK/EbsC family protein [Patescibacteria group bacterium]